MLKIFIEWFEYSLSYRKNEMQHFLDYMGIKNYRINNDYTVDIFIDGDLFNRMEYPIETPMSIDTTSHIPMEFRKVSGDFDCSYNQLTSLDLMQEIKIYGENKKHLTNKNLQNKSQADLFMQQPGIKLHKKHNLLKYL